MSLVANLTNESLFTEDLYQRLHYISRKTSLENCVQVIRCLPDIVVNSLLDGVSLNLDDHQKHTLDLHRATYYGISLHLDYLLLGNSIASDARKFKNERHFAKLSKATLNLAIGMSDHWLMRHYFVAPKLLWLKTQSVLCFEQLRDSGFLASLGLDSQIPSLEGKTEWRNFNQKYLDSLSPENTRTISEIEKSVGLRDCSKQEMDACVWNNPIYYLNYESSLRARGDSEFDIEYYTPYQKAWASIRNLVKNTDYRWTIIDCKANLLTTEKNTNRRK